MSDKSQEYYELARQMQMEARRAGTPCLKAEYQRLSEAWLRLAEESDGRRPGDPATPKG